MRRYVHGKPARNQEDSSSACGEISSGLSVTCIRETGDLVPIRFGRDGGEHEVAAIQDRWPGFDHEYVKVRTVSGDTYILRYDEAEYVWEISVFREAAGTDRRSTGRAPASRDSPPAAGEDLATVGSPRRRS